MARTSSVTKRAGLCGATAAAIGAGALRGRVLLGGGDLLGRPAVGGGLGRVGGGDAHLGAFLVDLRRAVLGLRLRLGGIR